MSQSIWSYRPEAGYLDGADLVGYHVEAEDGRIGRVDAATPEADEGYLVVDTGPWIFGKQVLIPVGAVSRIDAEHETVHLDRTRDDVKNAPEFSYEQHLGDADYRDRLGAYYGGLYGFPFV
ncbi:PRC-barrel domain-containing protein [Streptacidiphilus monticola]|uniref:PRC-barrel domain-containing protein n=1 Tax=Streptacidiphilus monticola TaxID=2161674 RepID=A0ABW1G655_9ACTN